MPKKDSRYLASCCLEIESIVGWGPASEWSTADFEDLSDMISEKTGRMLGATTLKRVWGRVRYESSPSQHTLDTLALFVGAESWRDYLARETTDPLKISSEKTGRQNDVTIGQERSEPSPDQSSGSARLSNAFGILTVIVVITAGMIWAFNDGNELIADPSDANVQFSSRKVSEGLPNSVVFDYRLAGIEADSFFIQQSWDARLRDQIDPALTQFTSIYYYPGHFWAKLIANETVLQEHSLIIPTVDWNALIDQPGPQPIYGQLEPFQAARGLRLDPEWVTSHIPDLNKGMLTLNLFNVGQFDPVGSQSVVLRADIRMESDKAFDACQAASIVLIGQHGRVDVPFALTGCSSTLRMVAGDRVISGQTNDLSGLGADFSDWNGITIGVKDRIVFIKINDESSFQTPFSEEIGDIVGLRFRFRGNGMIQNVSLTDERDVVVFESLLTEAR